MSGAALSLIETFRYEPAGGFLNLALHQARMRRSAELLGLPFSDAAFEAALSGVPRDRGARRVRLELMGDGRIVPTDAAFAPLPEETVWRVALAEIRLSSSDPLLVHKTSRRDAYAAARAEYPAATADEVLLLNERGEVCEGTITSIFLPEADGALATPPLSSGLLAGVLRQRLLEEGKARERPVQPEELEGRRFFVGNSLRGLIPAQLA